MDHRKISAALKRLATERYGKHELAPADTKSWLVSHEGKKGGNYWFTVTWSYPGILNVGGDIGEITLTHYNAMNTWVNAASWVHRGDYDYLLGKSSLRPEFDPDATYDALVEDLVREAKSSLIDRRDALREWREDMRAENEPRTPEAWEDPDECGPFWIDRPEPLRCVFSPEYGWMSALDQDREAKTHWPGRDTVKVEAPEGWEGWLRLYNAVGECWNKPDEIFTAKGRRSLLDTLRGRLDDRDGAVDLCVNLGGGDFYGSYGWSHHAINMIAALHRWAALVVAGDEHRVAKARAEALAEHRMHAAMFDRRMPRHGYRDIYDYAPGVIPFIPEQFQEVAHG
ncbi:hypothetical protein ABNQ39_11200 [Azospirillum sp. A26]|uniref:hypothetical protein n=1 Tax=Azospirillum sp. A26 TaxID=3160607 RepID=UPI00366E68CB